ncbi:MAG: (2Fe-2S) ferredoxin domain-containing protein [Clostridia bacterium]|nr:(2Fe-2S) ferredoxin domain-containing protein [Clostridia bacterium]
MVIVQICVGSSCHLKGAQDIADMMQKEITDNNLDDEVILGGSFCAGKCNRTGVTITVNDDVYTGITRENFRDFWKEKILTAVEKNKG